MIYRAISISVCILTSLMLLLTGTSNALLPTYADVNISFDQTSYDFQFTSNETMNTSVSATGTVTCQSYARNVNVILMVTADDWPVTVNPETMTFGSGTGEQDFTVVLALPTEGLYNASINVIVEGRYTYSPGGVLAWLPQPAQTTINIATINVTEPESQVTTPEEKGALGRYLPIIIFLVVIVIVVAAVVIFLKRRKAELMRFRLAEQ